MSERPTVGAWYTAGRTAPLPWRGVRVVVLGVSDEQKTARVEAEPDRYGRGYDTILDWSDLEEV